MTVYIKSRRRRLEVAFYIQTESRRRHFIKLGGKTTFLYKNGNISKKLIA